MIEQNSGASDAIEIIDVEEYIINGRKPPHGKRYRIRVDGKKIVFDHHIVTGEEILRVAELLPVECYSLYLKEKGCDFELIRPHEKVDLIERLVEHFVSKPPVVFNYFVDNEPETTEEEELTPNQILELAGILPVKDYYLVRVNKDGSQISYKDTPNKPIRMECPAVHYISVFKGETPVS
ncbi:multiubiquitin domain-containing protein [Ferruginibacter albus]|uniref:multiubiquitin domain-containing protein n=1 Tax=Ferruginibacter albus TaxID=2875540 RepID=UPI001CC3636F|nr:multiubiquitin domain-containing protein [Ferruginibacter albus]UAY51294.1 multiubiquitin domain-containing protein [Ferruginibacter albus]